jgi:flagellar biosynthesis protein FlhA
MDGASKFVRGDAIAGILITLINVIGGIVIGVVQKGMAVDEALKRYSLLSIGDGLVAQVPALVVSLAAGILVTRASEESDLGTYLSKQLTFYPRAVAISAAMMAAFACVPGMPVLPFLTLALGLGALAWKLQRDERQLQELLRRPPRRDVPPETGKSRGSVRSSAKSWRWTWYASNSAWRCWGWRTGKPGVTCWTG